MEKIHLKVVQTMTDLSRYCIQCMTMYQFTVQLQVGGLKVGWVEGVGENLVVEAHHIPWVER